MRTPVSGAASGSVPPCCCRCWGQADTSRTCQPMPLWTKGPRAAPSQEACALQLRCSGPARGTRQRSSMSVRSWVTSQFHLRHAHARPPSGGPPWLTCTRAPPARTATASTVLRHSTKHLIVMRTPVSGASSGSVPPCCCRCWGQADTSRTCQPMPLWTKGHSAAPSQEACALQLRCSGPARGTQQRSSMSVRSWVTSQFHLRHAHARPPSGGPPWLTCTRAPPATHSHVHAMCVGTELWSDVAPLQNQHAWIATLATHGSFPSPRVPPPLPSPPHSTTYGYTHTRTTLCSTTSPHAAPRHHGCCCAACPIHAVLYTSMYLTPSRHPCTSLHTCLLSWVLCRLRTDALQPARMCTLVHGVVMKSHSCGRHFTWTTMLNSLTHLTEQA
jgi:hypothetical protein